MMPTTGYQEMERLVHSLEKAAVFRKRQREKAREKVLEREKARLERTIRMVEKALPFA